MNTLNTHSRMKNDGRDASDRSEVRATETTSSWTVDPIIWLFGAIVVGAALRIHCLVFPYLWLDEYVTLWSIGGETYREMFERSRHWTASGPLFVLCYRLSCDLTGSVDWGLKLPSILAGVAPIPATWWVARRSFLRNDVPVVSAWFIALAPQFIHFSQEARPYMLGALAVMLSTGFVVGWIRTGQRRELCGVAALTICAVGFHLLAVVIVAAQNLVIVVCGLSNRWPRRRWCEWCATQALVAAGIVCVGGQLWLLGKRHDSMILETSLPMLTRVALDQELFGIALGVTGFLFLAALVVIACRIAPATRFGTVLRRDRDSILVMTASYALPVMLLAWCAVIRLIDPWPRYFFLYQSGLIISLAWFAVRGFDTRLRAVVISVIVLAMCAGHNRVGGVWSCRLNGDWLTFPRIQELVRQRIRPDDLVISRAGLIEANHARFLTDRYGSSYLKCFCEAKDGPVANTHLPLPFSPESDATRDYLEQLVVRDLLPREEFVLLNMGPLDFDYRDWLQSRIGDRFEVVDTHEFKPFLIMTRYRRLPDQTSVGGG